jgi:hypothetical protein
MIVTSFSRAICRRTSIGSSVFHSRRPVEVHTGALTTEVRSCLGSLAPDKGPAEERGGRKLGGTFV